MSRSAAGTKFEVDYELSSVEKLQHELKSKRRDLLKLEQKSEKV